MKTFLQHLIILITLFLLSLYSEMEAQNTIEIHPVSEAIKINGDLSEAIWKNKLQQGNFIQTTPDNGQPSKRNTEIAVLYDQSYLYVGAIMHVDDASEIRKQLTARDEFGNSDFFGLQIDPFGEAREGYDFTVTAAGVQNDSKMSTQSSTMNFNVVWESNVKLYENYWVVEMKIPFNSFRFPKDDMSNFKINFQRVSSSLNEESFWNPIRPEVDGFLNQLGSLKGLTKVNPPLNLSLYPFVSVVNEKSPDGDSKTTLNGGLDLKYVHNNAYTLDVSLIPDFSQAPSDDQIFNLSPFEIQYNENRQFFVEGTEIFEKGSYLYTRRIGGQPINSYSFLIEDDEEIISNPVSSNIINLIKVTGKSEKGLSIGVLNGLTAKSEAEVLNTNTGEVRKVTTNPLTNYNSLVLDQSLKNNSSLTFVNNSVLRNGSDYDANLTALLYRWYNKDRKYSMNFRKAISQKYFSGGADEIGHEYYSYFGKVSGKWTSGVSARLYDENYDPNDFGFLPRNNELRFIGDLKFSENNPKKTFSRYQYFLIHSRKYYYSLMELEQSYYKTGVNGNFKKNNHSFFAEATYVEKVKNFYEARIPDRHFNIPAQYEAFMEYQTNRNKNLSFAGYVVLVKYLNSDIYDNEFIAGYGIRARAGQHLSAYFSQSYENKPNNAGYITMEGEDVLFGQRSVNQLINGLTLNYSVNAKLNIDLRLRHYWIQVDYKKQFSLQQNGDLTAHNSTFDVDNYDDNFNSFTVDFLAKWQFAPASELSLGYKLGANYYNGDVRSSYFENLGNTLKENNSNTVSLKMTYFLDFNRFRKRSI